MTDKEQFQKTFEKLHASPDVLTEVLDMATNGRVIRNSKRRFMPGAAVAAVALILVLGSSGAAYAMDLGGVQRTVQLWIHGDQTNATMTIESDEYTSYTLDYEDANGEKGQRSGGGVAIEEDGTTRPLTEEEIADELNVPEVVVEDDASVWVYYKNQKMEITDQFVDGYCFIQLQCDGEIKYMTVQANDLDMGSYGYAMSSHGYVQPDEFNTVE